VYSLIRYTTRITTPNNTDIQLGNITYYQTVITNAAVGDRIWTFTMGGNIYAPAFWIVYQFDPLCSVPNGFDQVRLQGINFYKDGVDSTQQSQSRDDYEPLQGTMIVSNINISISYAPSTVNLKWYPTTGQLIFQFDLNGLKNEENLEVQYAQIKKLNFSPTTPQTFFLNMTVRDAVSTLSYDSVGDLTPGGGGGYNPVTPPIPEPTPTPAPESILPPVL
jgi:hypothetical protein